ncbi:MULTISPECIES: hypothetical protein [unclassified Desulfovibrio]|uniref:hypothetical protein n=1 Tax=unclassified Desulfovibrio TaxID=2593640 RepID=UPI001C89A6BD|nr:MULTISPECIES: hypothetical protein [unclassified Desulfovibrio]
MKLQKKTLDVPGIAEIPRPDPSRAGHRTAWLLALLALCAVSLAAYWLTRDEDTREQWRDQAARIIDNATSGTPLAGVSGFLQPPPPPLPASVLAPPTAPGTLSGRNVQGRVGGGEDAQAASGQSGTPGASGVPGPVGAGQASLPKVTEDSRVRPQFVEDLAAYLVSRFRPGQSGGELRVSVQDLNQRYGVRLPGPEEQGKAGREAILRYAFHPAMLQGLYGLYVERFLESLEREASAKGLSAVQTGQLRMALAGRLVMLAGALEGVDATADLGTRLRNMEKRAQDVVDINAQMAEAVFALDQLRESNAGDAQLSVARLRVEGLGARYRRALEERAAAQRALLGAVRQSGGQALGDDDLLFVAQWVDRRMRQGEQTSASVRSAAAILRDLARRSAHRPQGLAAPQASELPVPPPSGQKGEGR